MKWNDESVRTRLDEAWERGHDDGQAYPDSVPCPYDHIVKSDGFVCGAGLPECPECGRLRGYGRADGWEPSSIQYDMQ